MKPPTKDPAKKWAWHHGVLLSLRARLLSQRAQRLGDASEPLEPHSLNLADSATDEFDHDLALSRLSAGQDFLYEVDEAIKRIENGTYGFCAETGKPIGAARLKAVPWTRFAKETELRLEQKHQIASSHLGELRSVHSNVGLDQSAKSNNEAELDLATDESPKRIFRLGPSMHLAKPANGSKKTEAKPKAVEIKTSKGNGH